MSPKSPILQWDETGAPRSALYGDIYFSREDGLAESRAVFLNGCGLLDGWRERRRFVVAELGFGTGLNILALWDLWRREKPPGGQLHIFSIEAHPLSREEAGRALAAWPEVAELSERLLVLWPPPTPGFHRLDLAPDIILDLAVMEVGEALAQWRGRADAWFLDGFAPSGNPAMWRQAVLTLLGARSAPGSRAATFTVAGDVRRGLAAAGFAVEKRAGFGRKKQRLEAVYPGLAVDAPPPASIAILGAGIAGASLARAFARLGSETTLFDAEGAGAGASGNRAALVTPRLDAGLGANARLHAQAFERAVALYDEVPDAVVARGAVVLPSEPRDIGRFEKIAAGDLFDPAKMRLDNASDRLGERVEEGLTFDNALSIDPTVILAEWAPSVHSTRVERLESTAEGWRLIGENDKSLGEFSTVCIALGSASRRLLPTLPLQSVRGQASLALGVETPLAASFGGYAIAAKEGLMFGATFDRDDEDATPRATDDHANLSKLAAALPNLASRAGAASLQSRASIRAATPDRMPLAGELAPGVFVLTGLGSHGFTLAPLLAEFVAAQVVGAPLPLPADLAPKVAPERYFSPSKQGDETS